MPVIETGTGNCHVYVHESADFAKARAIVMNAKTQRVGVCNACESLLVDEAVASAFLPEMLRELAAAGVTIHGGRGGTRGCRGSGGRGSRALCGRNARRLGS